MGDIYSKKWEDWEIELPLEYQRKLVQFPIITKKAIDLLNERNKLIAERDARPNITNEEWIRKQNEVDSLNNELKEVRTICFKLIEKIIAAEKSGESDTFWKTLEKLTVLGKFISLIIELLKNLKGQ